MAYVPVPAKAKAAVGTKIQVKVASTFQDLGGDVVSIEIPSPVYSKIDVTHLMSAAKEYLAGMPDNGSLSLKCNYVPNSAEHKTLLSILGKVSQFEITFDIMPAVKCAFSALATGFKTDAAGPDDVFSGTLTLDVSGAIVWTP